MQYCNMLGRSHPGCGLWNSSSFIAVCPLSVFSSTVCSNNNLPVEVPPQTCTLPLLFHALQCLLSTSVLAFCHLNQKGKWSCFQFCHPPQQLVTRWEPHPHLTSVHNSMKGRSSNLSENATNGERWGREGSSFLPTHKDTKASVENARKR